MLAAPAAAHAAKKSYYVSLGDSYAQGYQPSTGGVTRGYTNEGYTDFLYKRLKAQRKNRGLKLVKLGCGGATTDSLMNGTKPCPGLDLPYASDSKATSQLTYAAKWMHQQRKRGNRIAYVTLSVGGNDFAACARAGDMDQVVACALAGVNGMKGNLPDITRTVRRAAGKKAIFAGSTYPDVTLGEWVQGGTTGQDFARASVALFRDQINPAMKSAYRAQKAGFVDATRGFGGYMPFDRTTTLDPYGAIPQSVANICTYGWYCEVRDIHLRASGYRKLAGEYAAVIRKLER